MNGCKADNEFGLRDALSLFLMSWYIILGLPLIVGVIVWWQVVNGPPVYRAVATIEWVNSAPSIVRSTKFERIMLSIIGTQSLPSIEVTAENDIPNHTTRLIVKAESAERAEKVAVDVTGVVRSIRDQAFLPVLQKELVKINLQIKWLQSTVRTLRSNLKSGPNSGSQMEDRSLDARSQVIDIISDNLRQTLKERNAIAKTIDLATAIKAQDPIVEIARQNYDMRAVVAASLAAFILAVIVAYVRFALVNERRLEQVQRSQNMPLADGGEAS